MTTFTTKDGAQIYYNDWGAGKSVVFSHGWVLSADAFESWMIFLATHGYARRLQAACKRGLERTHFEEGAFSGSRPASL